MGHRLFPVRAVLLAVITVTAGSTPEAALGQASAQTVGIRLVDAPTNRTNDPRAHEYIVDHVAPGTTITRRVEVANGTAKTQAVQLYAAAGTIQGGNFQFGDGHAANELTSWTTVDPGTVGPPPGGKSLATVKIAVPKNASAGERYAVVWAELPAAVPSGGGVGEVNRVGVRIYLSVGPGGEPPTDFQITTLQGRRAGDGSPVVAATVHNTGGRALDLSGELSLTSGPGGLSAGPFSATLGTTLGLGQTEPVQVTLDKALPNGPWDAKITLRSGTTVRDASASITFPAHAASSSKPVATHGGGGRSLVLPVVGGSVLLLGLAVFLFQWGRRRRGVSA